jgi:hypothetical protein
LKRARNAARQDIPDAQVARRAASLLADLYKVAAALKHEGLDAVDYKHRARLYV